MRSASRTFPGAAALGLGALAACGGGEKSAAGAAPADVVGYYAYGDPSRGEFHLALLDAQRFLLVVDPDAGASSRGHVGWYTTRGDSIFLSTDEIDARGVIGAEVIDLEFLDPVAAIGPGAPGVETAPSELASLPFERIATPAAPQQGGGGSRQGGGGSGGDP